MNRPKEPKMITIGRTTYTVEKLDTADMYCLTGPRGGQLVAAAYINNADLFHAWRVGGTHADLKVNGRTADIARADLEAAALELVAL